MIDRYARPQMKAVWETAHKLETWLKVELLICEALAERGVIPKSALSKIKKKATVDLKRASRLEQRVKHDVIAFLTAVSEKVGPEGRYLHLGATSSDILDTSLEILLCEAADLLILDMERLRAVLKEKALKHKLTLMIGRSHGVHAEPITFGFKMALWYQDITYHLERLQQAKEGVSYGKISGAMGTFAHLGPMVEEYVCRKSGLKPAPISSQIIQREQHAHYLLVLSLIASTLDKFATEIRHLQRTEVREVEEHFAEGQKGSSAMPHKRNPIVCENISGLARLVRSNAVAALENIPLWHERDISHSSVERVILPDSTIVLDFMLTRMTEVLESLLIYPENMLKNLNLTGGLIYSQRVLLELTLRSASREAAYRAVQRHAMAVQREPRLSFLDRLKSDPWIGRYLDSKELERLFDPHYYLRHLDQIYDRVFKE
jgi:adenylosuccinate lyase